jgi:hypothetical protein
VTDGAPSNSDRDGREPPPVTGFFAFPAVPADIGSTIRGALELLKERFGVDSLQSWEQNDVAGRFISDPIFQAIRTTNYLLADVTRLNFNVTYEIGFAIGARRRVVLVRNAAITGEDDLIREIGLFDTLGYKTYTNYTTLAEIVRHLTDIEPLPLRTEVNRKAPVYVVSPRDKTDAEIRVTSRIKKAGLKYRSFDPQEHLRLSAADAISNVAESFGVVVPLLSSNRVEHKVHNIRAAFVAGLSAGMEKTTCLLQFGNDPVPLDYRDLVKVCATLDHINTHIAEFAPLITEQFQYNVEISGDSNVPWLAAVTLGQSAAENEFAELPRYYIEIDEYQRAKRGEIQVVTGRKGSGKTALFGTLRDHLRRERQRIVLDLKPEGYQLLEFMAIIRGLEQASREHVISAFWEYLLLLEIANKLVQKDREAHLYNPAIVNLFKKLEQEYVHAAYTAEGDFAERMTTLTKRIASAYSNVIGKGTDLGVLSQAQLTNIIYTHNVASLRDCLIEYLQHKRGVWILFDNLDKGWPAHGIRFDDLVIVRSLLDALGKISRSFQNHDVECHGIIFLRNDVFELLLDSMPDRGKIARANLDWTDAELLRELLRRRIVANESISGNPSFDEVWSKLCESHIDGVETSQYLIDRSLMRPRALLDLVNYCRSHAVNLRHDKILADDIRCGEATYSTEMADLINYEIRDVFPEAAGMIYELLGESAWIEQSKLIELLRGKGLGDNQIDVAIDFLLWYGVLGILRDNAEPAYIYDMQYSAQRMRSSLAKQKRPTFQVNPAFWAGLEIRS